jgi:biotin carboxyl carrier protein
LPVEVEEIKATGPAVKTVTAPMVGVFYHAEQPGRPPLVEVGSRIERGSLIGVIEALQVITEVESDTTGTVQSVVAADGQPVEFGQPLVEIRAEA